MPKSIIPKGYRRLRVGEEYPDVFLSTQISAFSEEKIMINGTKFYINRHLLCARMNKEDHEEFVDIIEK